MSTLRLKFIFSQFLKVHFYNDVQCDTLASRSSADFFMCFIAVESEIRFLLKDSLISDGIKS